MSAPQSEFGRFATEFCRGHAREIILSPPLQIFWKPTIPDPDIRAAEIEEFFTEGRIDRRGAHADPKGET